MTNNLFKKKSLTLKNIFHEINGVSYRNLPFENSMEIERISSTQKITLSQKLVIFQNKDETLQDWKDLNGRIEGVFAFHFV